MPRSKAPATAQNNGKAATPAPTEPATTEQKLKEIDTELKATQSTKKQPTEQAKPASEGSLKGIEISAQVIPAIQTLPTSKSLAETLDEFFDSRTGRLFGMISTVFLLTLPAYSFGFSDGVLKGFREARSITPAATVPTPQPAATPAVPASVAPVAPTK